MKLTDDDGTGGDQGTMGPKDTNRGPAPEREKDEAPTPASSDARPARPESVRTRASGQELTTANKILVAALKLDAHQETFTAEDLIVVAWELFPESFGLAGYREKYPDSNRVLSKLMGSVGLCSRGWLEQVSTKTYKMTTSGRKLVASVKNGASPSSAPPPANGRHTEAGEAPASTRPARPRRAESRGRERNAGESVAPPAGGANTHEPSLAALRESDVRTAQALEPLRTEQVAESRPRTPPAVRTPSAEERASATPAPSPTAAAPTPAPRPTVVAVSPARPPRAPAGEFEGLPVLQRLAMSVASQKFTRGGLVTFLDACQFWAINQSVNPNQLQPRLQEIEALLKRAEAFVQSTAGAIRVNDRFEVTLTTVIGLQGLHRMLTQRYHRELDSILKRATPAPGEGASDDDGD